MSFHLLLSVMKLFASIIAYQLQTMRSRRISQKNSTGQLFWKNESYEKSFMRAVQPGEIKK